MKKNTKLVKIELAKFPTINIMNNPLKCIVNVKKLEGVLEVEDSLLSKPIIENIIESISKKPIELKISEIKGDVD